MNAMYLTHASLTHTQFFNRESYLFFRHVMQNIGALLLNKFFYEYIYRGALISLDEHI